LGNLTRNFVLHREDFCEIPVVLLSPQLCSVRRIHEIDLQAQLTISLQNPAKERGSHVTSAADRLGVPLSIHIARNGVAWDHSQVRDL
jgi:hypothetical protein